MRTFLKVLLGASIQWSILTHANAAPKHILDAISEVESGGDDRAVGRLGEISRFQLRKSTWRQYTNATDYRNTATARSVAERHLSWIRRSFNRTAGRPATDRDIAIVWNMGLSGYQRRNFNPTNIPSGVRSYADRVINLSVK